MLPVGLSPAIRAALLAFSLLSSAGASAGDYSLTYAIDADGSQATGKIETCAYDKVCDTRPAVAGLWISVSFIEPDHRSVELEVRGPPGCCYSYHAARTFYLEVKPGLLRVPIYAGRPRRENELVLNERFGVLYLQFANLR